MTVVVMWAWSTSLSVFSVHDVDVTVAAKYQTLSSLLYKRLHWKIGKEIRTIAGKLSPPN